MPCNRESLNPMPQLRVSQAPAMLSRSGFRERKGEERRAKGGKEMEGKFGCLDLPCFKSRWRRNYLCKNFKKTMNNKKLRVPGFKKSWCYQIQHCTIEDTFICTRNSENGCSDKGTEGEEQISGTYSTGLGS